MFQNDDHSSNSQDLKPFLTQVISKAQSKKSGLAKNARFVEWFVGSLSVAHAWNQL